MTGISAEDPRIADRQAITGVLVDYCLYLDRFERREGRWLIAWRRMLMNGSDEGFTVNLFPLERRPAPKGWVAPDVDRPPGRPPDS